MNGFDLFDLGDTAYMMKDNYIHKVKIIGVKEVGTDSYEYLIKDACGHRMWIIDTDVFHAINELINSLKDTIIE